METKSTTQQPASKFEWTTELIARCLKQWGPTPGSSELRWNGKRWVAK